MMHAPHVGDELHHSGALKIHLPSTVSSFYRHCCKMARKCNVELEKQLSEVMEEKQILDDEMNGLETRFETDLESERAYRKKKMRDLHAEYGVKMTSSCKAVLLRERQRVSASGAANIIVPSEPVDPDTEKGAPGGGTTEEDSQAQPDQV